MTHAAGNAPYSVCLDNGRHLAPGEIAADIKVTDRLKQMAADGLITLFESPQEDKPTKISHKTDTRSVDD